MLLPSLGKTIIDIYYYYEHTSHISVPFYLHTMGPLIAGDWQKHLFSNQTHIDTEGMSKYFICIF